LKNKSDINAIKEHGLSFNLNNNQELIKKFSLKKFSFSEEKYNKEKINFSLSVISIEDCIKYIQQSNQKIF